MSERARITDALPIELRAGMVDDVPHVAATWVHSHEESRPAQLIRRRVYLPMQRRLVDDLLARSNLLVACDREAPSVIYGWACYEEGPPRVLHYAFVRPEFRRHGLGRVLIETAVGKGPALFSHFPAWKLGDRGTKHEFKDKDLLKRFPEFTYNPFLAR